MRQDVNVNRIFIYSCYPAVNPNSSPALLAFFDMLVKSSSIREAKSAGIECGSKP